MTVKASIKHRLLIFSAALFLVILVGGGIAFTLSMRQIVRANKSGELQQMLQIERIKLEASVNGEIAIALKMADSPLIKRHFLNPGDPELKRIAFDEIAAYGQAFESKQVFWASDVDKEFYFDEDNHYTVDAEDPDSYWYKMTLYETEKYNFNINYNPEIQKIMLWINAPVFESAGNPIGLVGTGIDLSNFVSTIYRNFEGSASLYFFNEFNEVTGAQDLKLVTDKVTLDKALGVTGQEILARAKELKAGELIHFTSSEGEIALGTVPALNWYIAGIQPIAISDILNNSMTVLFLAMMAVIAVIFIVFYMFVLSMLKPLNIMVATLEQISGDWDLTRRLEVKYKDETGTLAEFFNLTFERMSELLKGIKGKAFALADTGDELNSTMVETSKAIDKIEKYIQDMRGMVNSQADEVNVTVGSIERIISGLDKLNNHIAVQADAVSQSSSAIEQMLANISSVTDTLVKNSDNITTLAESSETGRIDLEKVSKDIQEIARESEGLLEINSVMQNIASQTNLLSMNAAIEAAHAGESGKGFAVVADEIRKLAENSGKQSKTISAVLKKIKLSIDTITKSTGIVLERFGTIEKEVNVVSGQEAHIRNAMEEQGIGSRHILEAVTRLNTITGEVQSASSDMSIASREVLKQTGALKQISGNSAEGMDDMMQQAEMITSAVTRVKEISQENQENTSSLSADIARFKVQADS